MPLGNAQMQEGQQLLVAACREPEFAALTADYQRLFIGPHHLPAPPWESVYRTEEHLVFDLPTLEVRAAYQEMGLSVSDASQPDDHIGLELLFMAMLAERQADGDDRAAAAQAAFLKRHLLAWAPHFCADLAAGAATSLHKGLALLTQGMLAQEAELLESA